MAPGDLNLKKSWNPALMKNQKKLWEQEQQQLAEYKLIKQRQQELQQEREHQELLKLQYGDDLSKLPRDHKLSMNKLSWMYEGSTSNQKDTLNESGFVEKSDEFLLNKKKVESMLNSNGTPLVSTSKRGAGQQGSAFDKIVTTATAASPPKTDFSDDPLAKIKMEQLKKRRSAKVEKPSRDHKSEHRSRSSRSGSRSGSRHEHSRHKHRSSGHEHRSDAHEHRNGGHEHRSEHRSHRGDKHRDRSP